MKQFLFLIPIAVLFMLNSCKSPNGTYITYDIKERDSRFVGLSNLYNDTISLFLKSKLNGKKYQITYQDQYTILKDLQENEETILAKDYSYVNGTFYKASIPKGLQTFQIELFPDTVKSNAAILVIDLVVPTNRLFVPAQVGNDVTRQYGRAVCYLSKLEE